MAQQKKVMHAQKNTRMGQHSSSRKAGCDSQLLNEILPLNYDFIFKPEFLGTFAICWATAFKMYNHERTQGPQPRGHSHNLFWEL